MLDELHQPLVGNPTEEAFDVHIEHPVHPSRQQSPVERIQRMMRAAPRPEPVREAEKVGFVDGAQHPTAARWTILSSSAVTPSGRCPPSALGMYTLRTGLARYAPRFSRSDKSWRFFSRSSPWCRHVSPSTPGAASFLRLK